MSARPSPALPDQLDVTPVRKEGGTTNDLFTFLTPEPHLEVGAIILEQCR
jgi:hypothetical protein